jgi:hypothetical protein
VRGVCVSKKKDRRRDVEEPAERNLALSVYQCCSLAY